MKKYKCLGKKESLARAWANQFAINEEYEEAPAKLAKIEIADSVLFLYGSKDRNPLLVWFVDKDQFEECTN